MCCCCCCCCLGKCVSLWVSQSCSLSSKWIDFHRQSNRQLRFTWINTEIKMYYFIRCVNSKMYEFLSASTRYTFVIWHPKFFFCTKGAMFKMEYGCLLSPQSNRRKTAYITATRSKATHMAALFPCENVGICRKMPMILPNFDLYTYMPFASFSTLILP